MNRNSKPNQKGGLKRSSKLAKPRKSRLSSASQNLRNRNQSIAKAPVSQVAASYYQKTGPRKPSIISNMIGGSAAVRVKHSEYIGPILGSVAFASTLYGINPGLASIFPWLSQMAQNYESYRFNSLRFHFRTLKGSGVVGSLILAVDYDAADAGPVNLQQMLSYNNSIDSQIWAPETCLSCSNSDVNKMPQRYIRYGDLSSNQDIKTYDVGNLIVATSDCADSTNIGRLWVEYDVSLITPQALFAQDGLASKYIVGAVSVSVSAYLGTTPTYVGGLGVTGTGNTLTFARPGEYIVTVFVTGTGVSTNPTSFTGTHSAATSLDAVMTASTTGMCIWRVRITEVGQTLIASFAGCTTISASEVRIAPYQYTNA